MFLFLLLALLFLFARANINLICYAALKRAVSFCIPIFILADIVLTTLVRGDYSLTGFSQESSLIKLICLPAQELDFCRLRLVLTHHQLDLTLQLLLKHPAHEVLKADHQLGALSCLLDLLFKIVVLLARDFELLLRSHVLVLARNAPLVLLLVLLLELDC